MASIGTDQDEQADKEAVLCVLLIRRRRRLAALGCRRVWERSWIGRREGREIYDTLLRDLDAEDPEMFRRYHRLDRESFRIILAMVGPQIKTEDTNMRVSITPGQRLSATLRFLTTGTHFSFICNVLIIYFIISISNVIKSIILCFYLIINKNNSILMSQILIFVLHNYLVVYIYWVILICDPLYD